MDVGENEERFASTNAPRRTVKVRARLRLLYPAAEGPPTLRAAEPNVSLPQRLESLAF